MNNFLANTWTKRAASLLGLLYAVFICILSYLSVFYKIIITNRVGFGIMLSIISIAAIIVMFYSRKLIATKIAGFIMIPALLPLVLICFGSWEMIIPFAAVSITIFFVSGANEGAKTVLGTMYLLLYILASLAYFLFSTFLTSPAIKETIDKGLSPSGKYRYEVINTKDSSNGSTSVILEPNDMDLKYTFLNLEVKGYSRTLCVKRPLQKIEIEWKDEDLYINDERWFTPSQAKEGKWFDRSNRELDFS